MTLKLGPCEIGDWVEIEYSSPQIENNKKIEDAFVLGEGKMLPGFEENLAGMAENEDKKFISAFSQRPFFKRFGRQRS